MVPRRILFIAVAFVLVVVLLFSHPASREQLQKAKDYGTSAILSLTKGSTNKDNAAPQNVADTHPAPEAPAIPPPLPESADITSGATPPAESSATQTQEEVATATQDDLWQGDRWFFEADNELYVNPQMHLNKLKAYKPHNYKGPGHETIAIFLATRNGSLQDPYFLAAQQNTYRILWDERSKSRFALTAFVAPFVHQEQRDYLTAAGALVRELPLIEWSPSYALSSSPRWRDQFTKINLWKEGEYSKILYLDTDAFVIKPIDELLDSVSESRMCNPDLIPEEDRINVHEMCNYTFTAVRDPHGMLNAGMFVIEPNMAMHENLMRGIYRDRDKFDNNIVEQGYLQYVYREDGPFPGQYVERKWNAIETQDEDKDHVNVLHEKLWIFYFMPDHWALHYFNDTWVDMVKLYESPRFAELRAEDGLLDHP